MKMRRLLYLCVGLLAAAGVDERPGVQLTLGGKGLTKVVDAVVPTIVAQADKTVVPAESTKHYSFSDIHIDGVSIRNVVVNFAPPSNITIELAGFALNIPKTHFCVKEKIVGIHASCCGDFWASLTETSIYANLKLDDQNGKPTAAVTTRVHFGSLHFDHHFHNDLCKVGQDIIQLFVGDINKKIEKIVEEQIPAQIQLVLQQAISKALAALSMSKRIDKWAIIDYALIGPVTVQKDFMTISIKGEFKEVKHPVESPLVPPYFTPVNPSEDIAIAISEYVLDTAADVYTESGYLHLNDTLKFNTSSIPFLKAICKDCPIDIDYGVTVPPRAYFEPDVAVMNISTSALNISVISHPDKLHPMGRKIPVADLSVAASLGTAFSVDHDMLNIHFKLNSFNASLAVHWVGPVDINAYTNLVRTILDDAVVPVINAKLSKIPIPSINGTGLTDVRITQEMHAIIIQGNVETPHAVQQAHLPRTLSST